MVKVLTEKLEHIGPAEEERLASAPECELLARMPEASVTKRKRYSVICPNYDIAKRQIG